MYGLVVLTYIPLEKRNSYIDFDDHGICCCIQNSCLEKILSNHLQRIIPKFLKNIYNQLAIMMSRITFFQ